MSVLDLRTDGIGDVGKSDEKAMIPTNQSVEFEFIASATNYLQINCRRCGGVADVEYRGLDPVMPQIRTACRNCSTSVTFKISNAGALKGFHLYLAEQVWNVCSI